ncbi:glycoside hydrolase/deacetylase [Sistotremastrum suecicum HHB10207 ss-3]|uniref:chitin deacetylase n=1 Tax=Sistotremastrum suecicum HHB10207 ss-3 TaxID=1314776 RepID=A0A166F4N4_9AGAM|nr:glycoside hydrolase/deacetylase [Sistotremastrum suecicum HHB10207 ss-3]
MKPFTLSKAALALAASSLFLSSVYAHADPNAHAINDNHKRLAARQIQQAAASGASSVTVTSTPPAGSTTPGGAGSSSPAPAQGTTTSGPAATGTPPTPTSIETLPTDPFATIPLNEITSGAPPEATPPLQTTYQAGVTPPVSGAPVLPSLTIDYHTYPPENTVPPTDTPQVAQWMQEIQGIDPAILAITPTVDGTCGGDPAAAADTSRCWWTCGGCTNATEDIVTCPDKLTWGLSFDDGPSPYTPKVLQFLENHQLTGTFFAVGSRIVERPQVLQATYMAGHHIAVHTWSHSVPLTALTNEQVVAELGWSRQAIFETLGVSPLYWRPPWGDIDNRVRAISLAMGMRPIIWTRNPADLAQFDTNDWKVPGGIVTGQQSFQQFQSILTNATTLNTGFIVLQHDLFEQEVDLSTGYSIPAALAANFHLMDINRCQHNDPSAAYLETITNKSAIPTYPGAGSGSSNSSSSGGSTKNGGLGTSGNGNGSSSSGSTSGGAPIKVGLEYASFVALLAVFFSALLL